MFDIGFWELAVLGVIGLIVLGPERLPVVARTLGRWVGRARHYVNALTTELENEVAADDIRSEVRRARERIESETREFRADAERATRPLMEPIEGESETPPDSDESDNSSGEASPETTDSDTPQTATDQAPGEIDRSSRRDEESRP